MFWGIFFNLAIILVVVNGVIWLRSKLQPAPQTDERPLFGAVASSFGGADFWGAAMVVGINVAGGQLIRALTGEAPVDQLEPLEEAPSSTTVGLTLLIQASVFVATWAIIAWRNSQFLNWKWSGLAALLYFMVTMLLGVIVVLIAVL